MWLILFLACAPLDGALPAGTWGGEHWSLLVRDDLTGVLETDCAHGEALDLLTADEGELEVGVDWILEGGASDPEDPPEPVSATLSALVNTRRLTGVLAADDGAWDQDVDVRLGEEPMLLKCQ